MKEENNIDWLILLLNKELIKLTWLSFILLKINKELKNTKKIKIK